MTSSKEVNTDSVIWRCSKAGVAKKCALSKGIDYSALEKVKSKCGPDFVNIQPWDLFRLKNIHSNKPSLVQVFKTGV